MYAAATGNDSVVLALLEAGADPKYVKEVVLFTLNFRITLSIT